MIWLLAQSRVLVRLGVGIDEDQDRRAVSMG